MTERIDFDSLRQEMVERQLLPRGIKDQRLIDVMRTVPRHKFVPTDYEKSSYGDFPLPIGNNQTISQPYIVALMTQALDIQPDDRVLEIGTGSGYQTAILAHLAKKVYSVERIEELAQKTKALLEELGFRNVEIKVDDGTLGWQENAPYDKIIVTAAAAQLPKPLEEQLSCSGKIVIPLSAGFGQSLTVFTPLEKTTDKKRSSLTGFTKERNELKKEVICGCVFVPLIGKYGYKN